MIQPPPAYGFITRKPKMPKARFLLWGYAVLVTVLLVYKACE